MDSSWTVHFPSAEAPLAGSRPVEPTLTLRTSAHPSCRVPSQHSSVRAESERAQVERVQAEHVRSGQVQHQQSENGSAGAYLVNRFRADLRRAVTRTRNWLLEQQHPDGYWQGELEGDSILESEYILLLAFLGEADTEVAQQAAKTLLDKQLPEGGWSLYPGGPVEISGSVKAYFALKITGQDPSSPQMHKARTAILAHGGADAVNTFTRFYLALLGQIPYDLCPAVPPEFVLLPQWFPISLARVSAWSRTMIVPLSVMWATKPTTNLPEHLGIRELFLQPPSAWSMPERPGSKKHQGIKRLFSWRSLFLGLDQAIKLAERWGLKPWRSQALRAAEQWMVRRFDKSEGLGAIFPCMVWSIIALRSFGYRNDHPTFQWARSVLDGLILRSPPCQDQALSYNSDPESSAGQSSAGQTSAGQTSADRPIKSQAANPTVADSRNRQPGCGQGETIRVQPCQSPVWDTTFALVALAEAGLCAKHPAAQAGQRWLLDKQTTSPGDWSATVQAEPGGWYFEHANEFYPDNDDTAMAVMALGRRFEANPGLSNQQLDLLPADLSLFDERDDAEPDSTGQEGFGPDNQVGEIKQGDGHEAALDRQIRNSMNRGCRWLLAMQNSDGGWGAFDKDNDAAILCSLPFADHNAMIDPSTPDLTARVLEALGQAGYELGHPAVDQAVDYLRKTQEADGSWFGRWGVNYVYGTWQTVVGLRAIGVASDDPALQRAVNWLLAHQQPSGAWGESPESYQDPRLRGQGEPTPSQTAWALLALIAAGHAQHSATARGIRYLLQTQLPNGTWKETEFTGTGFPQVFYLKYHLYRIYFPLIALSRYARAIAGREPSAPAMPIEHLRPQKIPKLATA